MDPAALPPLTADPIALLTYVLGLFVFPLLTGAIKTLASRPAFAWLEGKGVAVNGLVSVLAFAALWALRGADPAQLWTHLRDAIAVAGGGSILHTVALHAARAKPEPRSGRLAARARPRRTTVGLLAVALLVPVLAGCAGLSEPVRAVAAADRIHDQGMVALGAAEARGDVTLDQSAELAARGRDLDAAIAEAKALTAAALDVPTLRPQAAAAVATMLEQSAQLIRLLAAAGVEVDP